MKKLIQSLALVAMIAAPIAHADSDKGVALFKGSSIGTFDLQKVMNESPELKAVKEKLDAEFKPKVEEVRAIEKGIKEDFEKLQRNGDIMSESERTKLENQIQTAQIGLQKLHQKYQKESSDRQAKYMQEFFDKVTEKVEEFAKSNDFDIILMSDAVPYTKENIDITDEVMKALGS